MAMADMMIILILVIILGWAISCMKKDRAKGISCIGCPDASVCEMRRKGYSCGEKEPKI